MEVRVDVRSAEDGPGEDASTRYELTVPELDIRQYLHLPFTELHRLFGPPSGLTADLLLIAGCCYVIDQIVPRSAFPDNWTRTLEVAIPVGEPAKWSPSAPAISALLTFLTGDRWVVGFSESRRPLYGGALRNLRRRQWQPAAAVCLFSGGLDSFVGAADWLTHSEGSLFLVGHYDLGSVAANLQARLCSRLSEFYGEDRVQLLSVRVGPSASYSRGYHVGPSVSMPYPLENTLRSRSLAFLALALYVAQQQRADQPVPVFIPENGTIALNPPLTPARIGSCSTRTAHPLFLSQFSRVMEQVGFANPVLNPLMWKSKGQVVAGAANPDVIRRWARRNRLLCTPDAPGRLGTQRGG